VRTYCDTRRGQRCIDRTCLGTFDTTTGTGWRLRGIRATCDIDALHIVRSDDGNATKLLENAYGAASEICGERRLDEQ